MAHLAIALEVLGGIELRGVEPVEAHKILVQPKIVALLLYLAMAGAAGRYQRRDQLVGLLWPELDQTHARTALRKAVHAIRAVLGAEVILSRGDEELALAPGALSCDAAAFRQEVEIGALARAMERYRGDLMPGFHLSDCADFERWLEAERTELREQAAAASIALAQLFEQEASMTVATRWARRAVRYAWDDERVLRRAISLLERAGDRAGALRVYDEFAERLKAEFSADPSGETVALVAGLRSKD
jgi:DNA-binding SARP family transcriptional activator